MNQGTQDQIDNIYTRQKEVLIGKRNVNCMSCSNEPNKGHGAGVDGRVYHGLIITKETSPNRNGSEDQAAARKLLNMKWDHIGLNMTNYSSTFDGVKTRTSKESRRLSRRVAGRGNQLEPEVVQRYG